MTWNASPGERGIDRKATAVVDVRRLGLDTAAASYLRLIAGPRHDARCDLLRFSSDSHESATANKRALVEKLVKLTREATRLAAQHGPLKRVKQTQPYA